jgi:hypothetical protein
VAGADPLDSAPEPTPRVAGSPALWSYVAYKSGSEPGVYGGVWYLVRSDGRVFVFSFGSTTLATRSISWPPLATAIDAIELLSEVH